MTAPAPSFFLADGTSIKLTATNVKEGTNSGVINPKHMTSMKSEEAQTIVNKLFARSVSRVSPRPKRQKGKDQLFGLLIGAGSSVGSSAIGVVLKVQKMKDSLAKANRLTKASWYIKFEDKPKNATPAQLRMIDALAPTLLHHHRPEVRALARGEYVHKKFVAVIILALQNQMRLGTRDDDEDGFDIPDGDDFDANENIASENILSHEKPTFEERQEVKRQYLGELNAAVEKEGGVIKRDYVPQPMKQKALEDAKIPGFDYSCSPLMMQYKCQHTMLASTPELQKECDDACNGRHYYRDQMELCHRHSISDQNKQGMWGKSRNECGKLVSNRCHDITLCHKPCHRIIDSLLRGEDIHEVVQ
jgi:hypothetical protein